MSERCEACGQSINPTWTQAAKNRNAILEALKEGPMTINGVAEKLNITYAAANNTLQMLYFNKHIIKEYAKCDKAGRRVAWYGYPKEAK